MTRRKVDISEYKGRYFRTLGKYIGSTGKVAPKKFLLSTDLSKAEVANRRLEMLWECVVKLHGHKVEAAANFGVKGFDQTIGECLSLHYDWNRITGLDGDKPADIKHGPIWLPESLAIAEAVRAGQHEIAVEALPDDVATFFDYPTRLASLAKDYGAVIAFRAASTAALKESQDVLLQIALAETKSANRHFALAGSEPEETSGQMLWQAIEAYALYARERNSKEYGKNEQERAGRIKEAHPDIPLSRFGMTVLQKMAAYWSGRPLAKRSGKPIATDTVAGMLKTTRRFVDWLHLSETFKWSKPVDADRALRVRVASLLTDDEVAELANGVSTWTVDELRTLYSWATDRDRLFILLGLNCGFSQAEICSLRLKEIEHERIKRVRGKSRVAGIWPLWPQTVKAIAWYRKTIAGVETTHKDRAIISEHGRLLDRQDISNAWNRLLLRVRRRHPSLQTLSFKFLRKTAGDMVRAVSTGEIAGVFLSHGKPVKSDPLSDVYTNRPFDKVADAVMKVGLQLQAAFNAVPDAFTQTTLRRTKKKPVLKRAVG